MKYKINLNIYTKPVLIKINKFEPSHKIVKYIAKSFVQDIHAKLYVNENRI